jgi:hypothetical protein
MKMWEKKVGILPALLVAVLSFGGFMAVATVVSHNTPGITPVSFANDGEDDGNDDHGDDGGDDEDENDDENKDEDKNDDKQSEADKKAEEAAKKKLEQQREAAKKAAEVSRSGKGSDDGEENEVDNETEDVNEDEGNNGDDHAMFKEDDKTVAKLQEEIAKAEKEILEKQAEGVDVTAALARLAQAKTTLGLVNGAFDSNDLEKAKDLSKETMKLTHFSLEKDLHDAKEVAEDAAKVEKRIRQTYGKIALLEAVGGDSGTFKTSLASFEADLAALKATIVSGSFDPETMSKALETLEKKVKQLKSSVEGAIYALGGTDSKLDDDYEDEADDVAEHLKDVAEIEGDEVGETIRKVAEDHKDASKKVGESVSDVDQRNPALQAMFGANEDDLNDIESQIAANKTRIATLLQAANAIEDQEVKAMVLEQVEVLKEQTSKLEVFVSGQRDRLSVFGWFFNLF